MAVILNLETSTKTCSAAIGSDGILIAVVEETSDNFAHSEKLNNFILEALKKANLQFSDLDAVAVSEGPGSYTGLRIGVSTAKGLCYALGIPLLSINTLKAMAFGAKQLVGEEIQTFIPMIDARRMEVFCAGFDADLNPVFETRAEVVEADSFNFITASACYFGDGAAKCTEVLHEQGNLKFLPGIAASARGMAPLAEAKFNANEFADLAYFEPFYLKDFIAGKKKVS